MFVPLKITTDYSLLKSCIQIDKLLPFLKEQKITTAAICDENLYGVMDFYQNCLKENITPIIGLEIEYMEMPFYCYAKNYQGYQNLLKIHSIKEKRLLTLEDLKKYKNNLKIIIPYENKSLYEMLLEIWQDLYIGYQTFYEKNNALLLTEKIVYVRNIRALSKKDLPYLDFLKMIETGNNISNFTKENYDKNYFTLEELEKEDIDSTANFVKDLKIEIPTNNRFIPHYESNFSNSYDYLKALTKKGLIKRLNNKVSLKYVTRLKYELDVIEKMGFVDYFLIVYDYVFYAKKNHILVGPGRGSAAGSLVSFSLGITDVDPLKYNLLFERFLNIDRVTMPDIDIDFEYTKRDQVISYVKEKYGYDCVAGIMTFGTLGSKLVLRDIGKCLELDQDIINKFVSYINPKQTLKENMANPVIKQYLTTNPKIKEWYQISLHLEGLKRHISTHAAGVVIASVPLDTVIPICYSGEEMLTGVTMNYLENLGLLKMDFLAIRNLTIIQNILDLIKENLGETINLNKINLKEESVLSLFRHGNTAGIFQFESVGMTNFLKKLKPSSFEDLVAALALYRPGPMENIDSFIKRKEGKEKVDYLHKDLEDILKETFGIIVYQEQIMQILSKIGGFSFSESDNIRRAMSKKKKEVIEEFQDKFIKGAIKKGYEKNLAEKIYALILKFANYGFNKAHSVSYALIGYQMAYLKVKYPLYYIANLLNMSVNNNEKTKEYILEAKKRNIEILKPDINQSQKEYKILPGKLLLPFSVIKNLGSESTETILKERNKNGLYIDFFDFIARTYGKSINKKTIECLIEADAFAFWGYSKNTLKENIESAINYATLVGGSETNILQDENYEIMKPTMKASLEKDIEDRQKELEIFGFYLSNHPSSKFIDSSITKIENLQNKFDKFIKCVVLVDKIRKIKTKKQEPMAFISASDETSMSDFIVFPNQYSLIEQINKNDLLLIEGKVTKRFDKYQVNVINITKQ